MPFQKGQSGNPEGRKPGIQDKRVALRKLLEPHAEELVTKARELAMAGDTTALRLCLERLIPPLKARDQTTKLDSFGTTLTEQGQAVLTDMAAGKLSAAEASSMLQALAAQGRIVEVDDLSKRVAELEKRYGHQESN